MFGLAVVKSFLAAGIQEIAVQAKSFSFDDHIEELFLGFRKGADMAFERDGIQKSFAQRMTEGAGFFRRNLNAKKTLGYFGKFRLAQALQKTSQKPLPVLG